MSAPPPRLRDGARRIESGTAVGCRTIEGGSGSSGAPDMDAAPLEGGRAYAAAVIRHAVDLGALSDELHHAARTPEEEVLLGRGAANALRALEIPAEASVLELGTGFGATTRLLAETAQSVDAVQPHPEVAAAVRRRVAAIGGAEVLLGELSHAAPRACYDLVLCQGLEGQQALTGGAVPELGELLELLGCWLRPGGWLLLSPLGSGLPDVVDSQQWLRETCRRQGYPHARVLQVAPDAGQARVVYDPDLAWQRPELAAALRGNRGQEAPQSMLLAGGTAQSDTCPWPAGRMAVYFSTDRAAGLCTSGTVSAAGGQAQVVRVPLLAAPQASGTRPRVRAYTEPVFHGPVLLDVIEQEPWRTEELLTAWRDLVVAQQDEVGDALWDMVPHNVLVTGSGLQPIDLEWLVPGAGPQPVLERGVLLTADELARRGWPMASGSSVRDTAAWMATLLDLSTSAPHRAAASEAQFQTVRVLGDPAAPGRDRLLRRMQLAWSSRLREPAAPPPESSSDKPAAERTSVAQTTARAVRAMHRHICQSDPMYSGNDRRYFEVTADALRVLLHALDRQQITPQRILDFGCGHGRVMRGLRAAFPAATLFAADTDGAGVQFCAELFGAEPADIEAIGSARWASGGMDLIWSGSVLTHLPRARWRPLLSGLLAALRPGGLLLFSTHGRAVRRRMYEGRTYGLVPDEMAAVTADYDSTGFGYRNYPAGQGEPSSEWGISLCSPAWIAGLLEDLPQARLVGIEERAWDAHHDVVSVINDDSGEAEVPRAEL